MISEIGVTEANKDLPFVSWLISLDTMLRGLSRAKTIAFISSCCERQYGNYYQFHRETGWGEPRVLCQALDLLWNSINLDEEAINKWKAEIEAVAPTPEDFSSPYTSAALDATTSLAESLDFCLDGDLAHSVRVACAGRDSIYMYVQQRDDLDYTNESEFMIYSDDLVEKELAAQMRVVAALEAMDDSALLSLRVNACDPSAGNLVG